MWLLVVLAISSVANAVDFDSLKWAEGSSANLHRSPNGGDVKKFKTVVDEDVSENVNRRKRMLHAQDYLIQNNVPKYLVRIVRANRASETKLTWCSGTIIAPNMVLTAAYCVMDNPNKLWRKAIVPFHELQIIAGEYNMKVDEVTEQIVQPIQYHVYPKYSWSFHKNEVAFDFAIIQTRTNFTYNERVGDIEMWTDPLPEVDTSVSAFLWFKMSSFGEAHMTDDVTTDWLFAESEGDQYYPRYQYYAWRKEGERNCKFSSVYDPLEDVTGYVHPYTDRSKVCMFTGLLLQVTYQPCSGDWGAPITWFNHTANKEYLMLYAPYEPVIREMNKISFKTVERWGVRVGAYKNFTDEILTKDGSDYFSELTVSNVLATTSVTFDLNDNLLESNNDDLNQEKHSKQYTFFLTADTADKFVNVAINYTSDFNVQNSTNTTIYVRNGTGGGDLIYHFVGGTQDILKTIYGASSEMTIEIHISDYYIAPENLTVGIDVGYWWTGSSGSNTGDICYAGYYLCEDKSYCVEPADVCDLAYDCLDGKDETLWCLGTTCMSSEYRCSTGECIPAWKACDGNCDCADTALCEDESTTFTCVEAQFNEQFPKEMNSAVSLGVNVAIFGVVYMIL